MLFDPFRDLWEILVLLPDVILLTEIYQVNDWFRRQQEERIYDLNLPVIELAPI
jgi:hypothetical protein